MDITQQGGWVNPEVVGVKPKDFPVREYPTLTVWQMFWAMLRFVLRGRGSCPLYVALDHWDLEEIKGPATCINHVAWRANTLYFEPDDSPGDSHPFVLLQAECQ